MLSSSCSLGFDSGKGSSRGILIVSNIDGMVAAMSPMSTYAWCGGPAGDEAPTVFFRDFLPRFDGVFSSDAR